MRIELEEHTALAIMVVALAIAFAAVSIWGK
jgi:hypothetical protein